MRSARPDRKRRRAAPAKPKRAEDSRAVLAALPDAVMVIDQALTIDFANRAAEELYGYAPGEMNGMSVERLMALSTRHRDAMQMREVLATVRAPAVRGLQRLAMRKDGGEMWIELSGSLYQAPKGLMLLTTVRDVSERETNHRALSRSRENLAEAQRIASVGSFERDLVSGEIEWTDEFQRIWGITDRPAKRSFAFVASLVHPDDRGAFIAGRRAAIEGKSAPQADFRITWPDGTERILHNEYRVDFDEAGKPIRLRGTVQDVTGRKRAEIEIQRSRENLAYAQRVAGLGSFDHDLVTGHAEWSDELYHLYGLDPEKRGGSVDVVTPLVHPEDRARYLAVRTQAAKGIRSSSVDFRVTLSDGRERVFHRECDVTFDASGKPIRIFGTVQDITARKLIEVKLLRSRENLARAQRLAAIGSFSRDLVTGEVEFSDEFYRIHGLEPGQAAPPHGAVDFLRNLVHPEDRERVAAFRHTSEAGQPTPPIDYRIIRPDGVERVLHRESDALFDEAGKPICLFGTLQDITERKRIETELRRSRENLARAHRVAGIGSFERDLITGKLEWSDEFLRIWGVERRPSHGTAELLLSLVHPEDRQKFVAGRDAALDRKSNTPQDFRIIRPDGDERTLHREYGVMFDDSGKPVRMFGTVQDITERRKAEIEIQRSRENLARAQRIASIGSFERDFVTGKIEWSDEMYRILGIERGGARPGAEVLMQIIHRDDREKFLAYRLEELRGQPAAPLEYRVIRGDGVERILRRESIVVFGEDKHPVGLYGTLQDITAQRVAERRERELERQLLHSHKLEALGTLASGIAHDLNNTLVPIMALSKLTARHFEKGSQVRANLETIYEASEKARDLVKRVVAFTRKEVSEKVDTDIGETVAEALKLLRATIPSSIALDVHLAPVPAIPADASQIHQAVTNLVTNAFHAIGGEIGTIGVSLDVVSAESGRSEICLSVSDTGAGMDEATQQRIFEPFFTTKPVGQGTGLGLSIVHGIVAAHGGRIEVKSAPGKGTRFDLYFPVPAGAAVTSSRPAA
jgi:PAS domain S-box-containing protein